MGIGRTLRQAWTLPAVLIAAGSLLVLAGCAGTSPDASSAARKLDPATLVRQPSLSHQIQLAERTGPGFLSYCPLHPGRASARYDYVAPHGGLLLGWCGTATVRRPEGDYVTFVAHWDARRYRRGTGDSRWVFYVNRGASVLATPTPLLVSQSGQLPP